MKKNILNLYEGFFDDLDKLNKNLNKKDKKNDGFRDLNNSIYDEHDFILSQDRNPEFFKGLCKMCKQEKIPYNENGFTQNDLDKITYLDDIKGYFDNVTSLNELQYFNNLKIIKYLCFYNCPKLKSIIFPEKNSLKIGVYSFSNCISLEKVFFPKNIIEIRPYSFSYCFSLEKITIPKKFKDNIKNIFYYVDLTNVDITYI